MGLPIRERRIVTAYATIELDNLLVMGRTHYLKSSLLQARTVSKLRVSCTIPSKATGEAAAFILSILNTGKFKTLKFPSSIAERDEQTFREPRDALKVLTASGASNIPPLLTAMAYNGNVFSEISTVRNFFAHRANNTNERVKNLSNKIGLISFDDVDLRFDYPALYSSVDNGRVDDRYRNVL